MMPSKYIIGLFFAVALCLSNVCSFAEEFPDWWEVDSYVCQQLIEEDRRLIDWSKELVSSSPQNPYDGLVKLNVCMRAALEDGASEAVRSLWEFESSRVDLNELQGAYYAATDDYEAWAVALQIVETFAPRISGLSVENRLLRHFRDEQNTDRWTDKQLIEWLDARIRQTRDYDRAQERVNSVAVRQVWHGLGVQPIDFWQRIRLQSLDQMGRVDAELARMAEQIRVQPTDADVVMDYLNALVSLSRGQEMESSELDWMVDVCRPEEATVMRQMAAKLTTLRQHQAAEHFLTKALETPLSAEEIAQLAAMCQMFTLDDSVHQLWFEIDVREKLAKCLLELGDADVAQAEMVKAADMRQANNLAFNPYLSGLVQGASGARVIEGRILEQEAASEDDPDYWRNRANYYRGRNEADAEEAALRRGFALTEPQADQPGKGSRDMRNWLLSALCRFLDRQGREVEAVELLLEEMKTAPIGAASSDGAARFLGYDLSGRIDPNEAILWDWLGRRSTWSHTEERLLWRMLERSPVESLSAAFDRATALATDPAGGPTRVAVTGWVFNRMDEPARSVPLLQHVVENAPDEELKQRAAFTLLGSYLDLKDWSAAESVFDLAVNRLNPSEQVKWLGKLALIAAEQSADADAMRLFRRVANCSLREADLLRGLAEHGLAEELKAYYEAIQVELPDADLDAMLNAAAL